jgi:hypothetical protein
MRTEAITRSVTATTRYLVAVLRTVAVSVVAVVLLGLAPAVTSATVPPRNCGPLTVGSRHYLIKADQLRCSTAKTRAKSYLVSHRKPSGFSCRDFRGSKMAFRCSKGVQVFFAIRR